MIKLYPIVISLLLLLPSKAWSYNDDSSIVLIFDNIPPFVRSVFPFPKTEIKDNRFQITIFDDFYQHSFNPRPSISDTIIFHPKNDHIVISFVYLINREPLNYIINKGDTVTFNFFNGIPYAKSKAGVKHEYLNYEYNRLIATKNTGVGTAYEKYRTPPNLILQDSSGRLIMQSLRFVQKSYYDSARHFLKKELSCLKSSKGYKYQHPAIFDFYVDKLIYQIAELDFEQHKLSADSLKAILALNKQMPVRVSYSYFLSFLEKVSDSVNVNKSKLLKHENGSEIDYREVYDRTSKWSAINDFYKKQLLYKYLKKIGQIFSASDIQLYLSKFLAFSNDTLLANNIKNEFFISENPENLNKDSLYMADPENNKLSFQTFLQLNKGKIIYIDFWASWCIPCRREMKHAQKLREFFKNKDVVFAYFSVDKSKNEWLEASKDELLNKIQHNYILTNAESATFLQSINFGPIPRYLLYDKQGKLVHKNAPPPSSEETSRLLKDYLSK